MTNWSRKPGAPDGHSRRTQDGDARWEMGDGFEKPSVNPTLHQGDQGYVIIIADDSHVLQQVEKKGLLLFDGERAQASLFDHEARDDRPGQGPLLCLEEV